MNVKECYELMNSSYEDAKGRLMNDKLIERFMLKFPKDDSMPNLRAALLAQDYNEAFRWAHTLKGVAGNLAFTSLAKSASALTEALRAEKKEPDLKLVQAVEDDYTRIIEVLGKYQNGN